MDAATEKRMRVMLDKQDIHDVLMRYCRGIDRCDGDLIASAFHQDAVQDDGKAKRSAQEFARAVPDGLRKSSLHTSHFIGNELIEVDGDVAYSEIYFIAYMTMAKDGKEFTRTRGGRYVDRFERRNGEWKIALRQMVDDFARLDEVHEKPATGGIVGQRSHEDAVWKIREAAR